jgi:basic membrane lipoprotein Med (substrate-binding protein (PBP1-ABC) superfamily)
MRANPVVRALTAAMALTLAVSSAAAAQTDAPTRFPTQAGATLVSAVMLNALDGADTNSTILNTARSYHELLGGKPSAPKVAKKNADKPAPRGGFITPDPIEGTDAVTEAALEMAGEDKPDILIVSGGDWQANVGIARLYPTTMVLDINQPRPCLDADGRTDLTGECLGSEGGIPGNYLAMEFAVEEGAYLAGVVAARESRGQSLGVISGALDCLECDRYVTGFINGARSVEPEIEIDVAYLAEDEIAGFSDRATAKIYADAFIDVYQPGVLLPVGRGATMGMIEAACDAGVKVIGAGIDVSAERPDFAQSCVMVSIVPDVARSVEEAMYYHGGDGPPVITYDLARGGVQMTDEWRVSPTKRVDTNEFYDTADVAIKTGQIEPCPDGCGVFAPVPETDETTTG